MNTLPMGILHIVEIVQYVNKLLQQCHPHRKVPYPVGGVLSLDVAGPLVPAKDIGGLYARWMLVGTLTWAVPAESDKMKDPEVPKADGN